MATNTPAGYAATGLPTGLTVNPASGLISETATAAGSFSIGLTATDAGGTGTSTLTLTISDIAVTGAPTITSATNATGRRGV